VEAGIKGQFYENSQKNYIFSFFGLGYILFVSDWVLWVEILGVFCWLNPYWFLL
jgi:hypothetical protein